MESTVVLSAYNGEKYLGEQLDSIISQSIPPSEIVVVNDCSTDSTSKIIREYVDKNPSIKWQVIEHENNKGYIKSFVEAIEAASNEYIFLSDQDDIWMKDKIEQQLAFMEAVPDCLLLCTDFEILCEKGGHHVAMPKYKGISKGVGIKLTEYSRILLSTFRPGCTYCIRKSLIRYKNYMVEDESHDSFLFSVAAMLDGAYILPKKIIRWRRHQTNVSNRPRPIEGMILFRSMEVAMLESALRFISDVAFDKPVAKEVPVIKRKIEGYAARKRYLEHPNLKNWFKLFPYYDVYENWFAPIYDGKYMFSRW